MIVLSFFVLRSIIISLISGIIIGFVFLPLYNLIQKKVKNKNLAASIVCAIVIIVILVPIWFLTPILLKESIQVFIASQNIDFATPIKTFFPSAFFVSPEVSTAFTNALRSLVTNFTRGVMNAVSEILLNAPTILLHIIVILFVFFFVLKDNKELVLYIQSILPFSKETEKKIFKSSKEITFSILYGEIVMGLFQGILTGFGFYLLGIPNALFLGVLATIVGVLPFVGPALIWIPVTIFAFINGEYWVAFGVLFIGVLNLIFENSLKPMIIAKRANVHPVIILLGMIGGIFFFGFAGFIIGPLVLSYLLIILEIYRDKKTPHIFIQKGA